MSVLKKNKPKYMQDLIPIEDVVEGLIKTKDGRYLKVVEIEPVNFDLKDEQDKAYIIGTFASWLKICPKSAQIKVLTRKANADKYLANVEKQIEQEEDLRIREIYQHYRNIVKVIGSKTAVTRRFFLIIPYEPVDILRQEKDPRMIAAQLNKVVLDAKHFFENMGNNFIVHMDPMEEELAIGEFLFMHFNRNSFMHESFIDRVNRIVEDAQFINRDNPGVDEEMVMNSIPYASLIAPTKGADFKSFSDCYIMDGLYWSHMFIRADGYPKKATDSGWLAPIFTGLDGADLDIFYRKEDRIAFLNKFKYLGFASEVVMNAMPTTNDAKEELNTIAESREYFKDALSGKYGSEQDPFYVFVLLTISSPSYEGLCEKKRKLEGLAITNGLKFGNLNHAQHLGFEAAMPFNNIPASLYNKGKRNITTDGLCGFYPFTAFEVCDDDGIFIGENTHNDSLCVLDPFDTSQYPNANMTIFGDSGAGKTFLLLLLAIRFRLLGNQIFMITQKKAHEFKRVCTALGGSYIKLGPSSTQCMNILDIRPPLQDEGTIMQSLYGYDFNFESLLMSKIQEIITWFVMLIPDLDVNEEGQIDIALVKLYEKFGITKDNNSLYLDPNDRSKGAKEMPILEDLYNVLLESDEPPKRVIDTLKKFVYGSAQSFNGHTNVDLDNKFVVFDLEGLTDSLEAAVTYQTITSIINILKEDTTKKQSFIVEEGWAYISKSANEKAAKQIKETFKIIRGYGANAILSTQEIDDLISSDYGKSVLACSSLKVILKMAESGLDELQKTLKLSSQEIRRLPTFDRGNGFLLAGNNHIPIQIIGSEFEEQLITTDRKILEKQYNQMQYN